MTVKTRSTEGEEHVQRVRRICMSLPGCEEKLSHGEPTWFVRKRVFVMFANNHHNDGHVAGWLPVPPGLQESLVADFAAELLPAAVRGDQGVGWD